jgi:DNA-binding protein HU-beta
MTKAELASAVSKKTGVEKTVAIKVIEAAMDSIKESVAKGENVYLRGFGTFAKKKRAKKIARNISKGTAIEIPERNVPHFKVSKKFLARE